MMALFHYIDMAPLSSIHKIVSISMGAIATKHKTSLQLFILITQKQENGLRRTAITDSFLLLLVHITLSNYTETT